MKDTFLKKRGKHIYLNRKELHTRFMALKYQINTEDRINQDVIMEYVLSKVHECELLKSRIQELESILGDKLPEMN